MMLRAYWATPLLLAAALLDFALQGGHWRDALPASPMALPGYALVFGMPHILASFFAFADPALARASASVLRPSLAWAALGALLVGPFMNHAWAAGVVIATTMVHVLGQQSGLAVGQARLGARPAARAWRALLAVVGAMAALAIGGEAGQDVVNEPVRWLQGAGVLLMGSTPLAAWLAWQAHQRGGDARGLVATQATLIAGFLMTSGGYPLLGIALLRLVHDITAFAFYAALADARERAAPGANRLYRALGLAGGRPGRWLWPLAAVMAALMAAWLPPAISLWLVFAHYLAEHRLWRAGSPLRQSLVSR